jgi:hypothetical protein
MRKRRHARCAHSAEHHLHHLRNFCGSLGRTTCSPVFSPACSRRSSIWS